MKTKETMTALHAGQNQPGSISLERGTGRPHVHAVDVVSILVASIVVGLLFNASNPDGVPMLPESLFRLPSPLVSASDAKKVLDEGGAVIVDARPAEFYRAGHVKGAINVPGDLFDIIYGMKLADLKPETAIIVYGRTISRRYDEDVAHRLSEAERKNVKVLNGGLSAWESRGYPVEQ